MISPCASNDVALSSGSGRCVHRRHSAGGGLGHPAPLLGSVGGGFLRAHACGHCPALLPVRRQTLHRLRAGWTAALASAAGGSGLHLRLLPLGRVPVATGSGGPGGCGAFCGAAVCGLPALHGAEQCGLHIRGGRQCTGCRLRGLGLEPLGRAAHPRAGGAPVPHGSRSRGRGRCGAGYGC